MARWSCRLYGLLREFPVNLKEPSLMTFCTW
jgi:hypothetical protein